jgi:hypothetical protein
MGYAFFKMSWYGATPGSFAAPRSRFRQEFGVGNFEKLFILVDFVTGQGADLGIGEGTKDKVHLAHAAMPRAEQELAAAGVQPLA